MDATVAVVGREPWNKGKLVGQKAPLKVKDIWAIRVRLQPAPGHIKLESTVRYLGIEVGDALEIAEQTEV
jgi:hypothetical protein